MRSRVLLGAALLTVAACSGGEHGGERGATRSAVRPTVPPTTTPAEPTTTVAPTTTAPAFDGSVAPITADVAARMPHSWRPGCPVPLDQLRLLTLDYWGYDGAEHRGELVIHTDHADAMLGVFRTLYDQRFPIERMELVDAFGGDDFASTRANNTAAFNCRSVVGRPGSWSEHAFGRAIDVNPLVNPYVLEPRINDPLLAPYLDRSQRTRPD